MIETGFNKKHETAEHTTPDFNVPIKGTDTSIIDSEAFHPARVGPPLLPAEERDAAANRSQQQDNYVKLNNKKTCFT